MEAASISEVGIIGEFVSDCGEWTIDVNHDGAPDVVTAGWMTEWAVVVRESEEAWVRCGRSTSSRTAIDTEGGVMADINGDGKPDLVFAHYNHSGMIWVDFSGAGAEGASRRRQGAGWPRHRRGGHRWRWQGGHSDANGWFKQIDANNDKWEWHGDWKMEDAGFPDHRLRREQRRQDGRDLRPGPQLWPLLAGAVGRRRRTAIGCGTSIDESFSQVHALKLVDIDGDGEPELLAGKRYRGHNGNDPGSYDPLVIYYYKIDRKTGTFSRYPIT